MRNIKQYIWKIGLPLLIIANISIWFISGDDSTKNKTDKPKEVVHNEWTCSMHPQIRSHEEGDCPLCGMDLIVADGSGSEMDPFTLGISQSAKRMAGVEVVEVVSSPLQKELSLYGKTAIISDRIINREADFDLRVVKLYKRNSGEKVSRGEPIIRVFSEKLLTIKQEVSSSVNSSKLYKEAILKRLEGYRIDQSIINEMVKIPNFDGMITIRSEKGGFLTSFNLRVGDHIKRGGLLFQTADLSKVWGEIEVNQMDLPDISVGDRVEINLDGNLISTKIDKIDPLIHHRTGVATAYVIIDNKSNRIFPTSYFSARVRISQKGKQYLKIPSSALLWSGKRSIVYKSEDKGYRSTEVNLYSRSGDYYYISGGVNPGDMIVSKGLFSIDAAAQLNGGYSMMSRPLDNRSEDLPNYKAFTTKKFDKELKSIFDSYLKVKDSYVETDSLLAGNELKSFKDIVSKGVALPKTMDSEDRWVDLKSRLLKSIDRSIASGSFGKTREEFKNLSEIIYKIVKIYGIDIDVYHQYCPMAFDDTGGYWLSDSDKILNPYFGDLMLRCGEVREVVKR